MTVAGDYCAFTKAIEHLGDRWSLLIVRELAVRGPLGFNALVGALPGVISRSVLARRLRKLEDLGLIERDAGGPGRAAAPAPHRLTTAGEELVPTLLSLRDWAEQWVPEGLRMAERDPSIVGVWLTQRVHPAGLPERTVTMALELGRREVTRLWLVLERGAAPSLCLEDPQLDPDRYVYVEAEPAALFPISRGSRDWASAIADGSVALYGESALLAALPGWFLPADRGAAPPARPGRPATDPTSNLHVFARTG